MGSHRQDDDGELPPAKFQRFEKVLVVDVKGDPHPGTVLWRDHVTYGRARPPVSGEPPERWSRWVYAVCLPDLNCCPSLEESRLRPTGEFDTEDAHLGKRFEISFDTILGEDFSIIEGTYRVPGRFWQVFYFEQEESACELRHEFVVWPSGITGIQFQAPREAAVDQQYLLRVFSSVYGREDWVVVRGPDSLLMK